MADPKKPTKRPPLGAPLQGADGPIPWENWDNDQRAPDDSKPPGDAYDHLMERDSTLQDKTKKS